jgi:hypothetical protein
MMAVLFPLAQDMEERAVEDLPVRVLLVEHLGITEQRVVLLPLLK